MKKKLVIILEQEKKDGVTSTTFDMIGDEELWEEIKRRVLNQLLNN